MVYELLTQPYTLEAVKRIWLPFLKWIIGDFVKSSFFAAISTVMAMKESMANICSNN